MIMFSKRKYIKIFIASPVIAFCILSISIEKEKMTSSFPYHIKGAAIIQTMITGELLEIRIYFFWQYYSIEGSLAYVKSFKITLLPL